MSVNDIEKQFELLKNTVRSNSSVKINADISNIDEIINKKIEDTIKDSAPSNFHMMYSDFKAEYEKFKDFILYEKLIGKNIVALGGGFSSGKSSFLNAVFGKYVLPEDLNPSTSVPTFIISGEKNHLSGINIFDAVFEIEEILFIREIGHGFGKNNKDEENVVEDVVTFGHIIESLFLTTPMHKFSNIAYLDTPGYSKPDNKNYSAKTDENIARRQLNTANCIMWFIQADAGTITEEDISFIKTLNETTPKLIVLNKADKKPEEDIEEIIAKIKSILDIKAIKYEDVLAYSSRNPEGYDAEKILKYLEKWNVPNTKNNFAVNFKKLFVSLMDYYEDEIEKESKRVKNINKAITLTDDVEVSESLNYVLKTLKINLEKNKEIKENIKNIQKEFFTELKIIGDIVGIEMPEPSKISLMTDKIKNPLDVIKEYMKNKEIKVKNELATLISEKLENVSYNLSLKSGGLNYKQEIKKIIMSINEKEIINNLEKTSGGVKYQEELISIIKETS